jgi:enamine deaminase RidA (YjgF/YER057c/UK114 family)
VAEDPALGRQFQRIGVGAEAFDLPGSFGGSSVGVGDLAAQVEQCFLNVGTALAAVGGSFDDLAKLTVYVVDWTPDKMPTFLEGVARAAAKLGVTPVPPSTLLGVAALDVPDHLVEVEATAVVD